MSKFVLDDEKIKEFHSAAGSRDLRRLQRGETKRGIAGAKVCLPVPAPTQEVVFKVRSDSPNPWVCGSY